MQIKFTRIALLATALLLNSTLSFGETKAALKDPSKPVILDAAGKDTRFQLFEGDVVKIDQKTRTITFKNMEGESKFVAGPEIKNFAQIKVGDHLNVTYELAVAVELIKSKNFGIRSEQQTTTTTTGKPGDKPSAVISNTTTVIADVVAVDVAKQTVSIKAGNGKVDTVKVKNPELLKDVAVGEQVKIIYYDAMAAAITSPKK